MSGADYLVGLCFFLPTVGGVLVATGVLLHRRCRDLRGSARFVSFGLLASAVLIVVHLVPGALGLLTRTAVLLTTALALAAALAVPAAAPPGVSRSVARRDGWGPVSVGLACLGTGLVAGYVASFLAGNVSLASATPDMVHFHLPDVARWIQTQSLWPVHEFIPDRAYGYYPQNGDVVLLAVMLPWENDFLARLTEVPYLALLWGATYALSREVGARATTSALTASALLSMPAVMLIALEGLPDTFMLATFAGGLLFLVRHWRQGQPRDLVLAGLGLGLSFGTKWYAVAAVGIVVAVWAAAWLLSRRSVAGLARAGTGLTGVTVGAGGFWLLRNLVESGNPFFPVKVSAFGVTLFDAPRDIEREAHGFTVAHYLLDGRAWREELLPEYTRFLGLSALVLAAGLAAGAYLAARLSGPHRSGSSQTTILVLTACALLIAIAYVITPYTAGGLEDDPILVAANSRYIVPGLVAAAAAAAWVARGRQRLRLAIEIAAVVGVIDGLARNIEPSLRAVAVGTAATVICAAAAWLLRRGESPDVLAGVRGAPRRSAVAALVLFALLVGLGQLGQERFNDRRYVGLDPSIDWINVNAPTDQRVGLAGEGVGPVIYPAFGPRLENDVEYIGPFVEDMLRPHVGRLDFLRAVRDADYGLVLVQLQDNHRPGLGQRQAAWLRSEGFSDVTQSSTDILLKAPDFGTVPRPPAP